MCSDVEIDLPATPAREHAINRHILRRCGITSGQHFLDECFSDPTPYVELLGYVVCYALMDGGVTIQWEADAALEAVLAYSPEKR